MANPDAWEEIALIGIQRLNGTEVQFAGLTESIDFDEGEKDIEYIPIVNGGGVTKNVPAKESTITLEAYPLQKGTYASATATGFDDLFHGDDSGDVINTTTKDRFRVTIMWTKSTTATASGAVTAAAGNPTYRRAYAEARLTSVKPSFTDGILKFSVKFKVPPFGKDAVGNIKVQSLSNTDATGLTALAAYAQSGDTITRW